MFHTALVIRFHCSAKCMSSFNRSSCVLSAAVPQVCTRWRDVLYARPRLWTGLVPVVRCREARAMQSSSRTRLYASLVRRGFHSLVLLGAADEDIPELTRGFPLAQRYVHSLSLRCCAVTDRGLEALLDHLQVNSPRGSSSCFSII